jgi:hypothetical protein
MIILPLGLIGKAEAGSCRLTWTAWVQFQPFPQRMPALLIISITRMMLKDDCMLEDKKDTTDNY